MTNDICGITDLDREICDHCQKQEDALVTAPTVPGLYPDLPEDVYHGDRDSLSSTGVRQLVKAGGAAKFRFAEPEDNDAFDIGAAAHTMLLRTGAAIEVVDASSWQTKDAKAAKAKARREGKTPLLVKQHAAVTRMVDAAMARPEVAELFPAEGVAELSAYAMDPDTWVMLRARLDYGIFDDQHVTVVDYKTSKDASPAGFEKAAANYGYHVQEAHYRRVLAELGYAVDRFVFVVQEKTAPYLTSLHEFDSAAVEAGDRVVTTGSRLFAACREADDWPGYGDHTYRMTLPAWVSREW